MAVEIRTCATDEEFADAFMGIGQYFGATPESAWIQRFGGITFAELGSAQRVEELRAGALARADTLFRSPFHPWCREIF